MEFEKIDNLMYEKEAYNLGYNYVAGVDEVGRGPLVGPVVTACVILDAARFLTCASRKRF